jgi:glycosyltransferase involved in cell wall biosynthesis
MKSKSTTRFSYTSIRRNLYNLRLALALFIVLVILVFRWSLFKVLGSQNQICLVSVVIPTFHTSPKTVANAIRSVLSNADMRSFIEIIVVDDASFSESIEFTKFSQTISSILDSDFKISFLKSDRHSGLARARNIGISASNCKWILPLDSDDQLESDYFYYVQKKLSASSLSLHDTSIFNVIMTGISDFQGRRFEWQPSAITTSIHVQNVLHCCGLFLKSLWTEFDEYESSMILGWEDWDFWTKLQSQVGLNVFIVPDNLYRYNIGLNQQLHMSSFCANHHELCTAVFQSSNMCLFSFENFVASVCKIHSHSDLLKSHPLWSSTLYESRIPSFPYSLARLLVAATRANASLRPLAELHFDQRCPFYRVCEEAFTPSVTTGSGTELFHIIITKVSHLYWMFLLRHSIVSILLNHPSASILLHVDVHVKLDLGMKFEAYFGARIQRRIICSDWLAAQHQLSRVAHFMATRAFKSEFYYSHFTDYYRLLVLYSFGGNYIDTDIVLRNSTSSMVLNSLAQESEQFVNGAFMKFEKTHPFLRYCLEQIPNVYDSSVWNIIGPALLTNALKQFKKSQLNILPISAFYSVKWNDFKDILSHELTDDEFHELIHNLGYHFWGKELFENGQFNHRIRRASIGGRILAKTCIPRIMECLGAIANN